MIAPAMTIRQRIRAYRAQAEATTGSAVTDGTPIPWGRDSRRWLADILMWWAFRLDPQQFKERCNR